jgi:hypothetical protein
MNTKYVEITVVFACKVPVDCDIKDIYIDLEVEDARLMRQSTGGNMSFINDSYIEGYETIDAGDPLDDDFD